MDARLDSIDAPVVITGAAGFIGFHFARRLLEAGLRVVGFDNLNAYYDPDLKLARLRVLNAFPGFRMIEGDLADRSHVAAVFAETRPTHVAHLAAQAGVRYSIDNPSAYADSNLVGFLTVLEGCRASNVAHLLYASSSSVYGGNRKLPFSVSDPVDHPVSLYAATKRANELIAHSYCHLYGFPATALRFFTVYGRYGRPDMAYWKFTEAIHEGRPISVFNYGDMSRDFTHVADVVEAMARLLSRPAVSDAAFDAERPKPETSWAPHRIYNIGAKHPESLRDMISIIEHTLNKKAEVRLLLMQPGDVEAT